LSRCMPFARGRQTLRTWQAANMLGAIRRIHLSHDCPFPLGPTCAPRRIVERIRAEVVRLIESFPASITISPAGQCPQGEAACQ
jgi:hypothetical protein